MTSENPVSVEEAGALLGAAITKCNVPSLPSIKPPKGMHSSFAIVSPAPSSDLFSRLYQLRKILRQLPKNEPLLAAPSLLAVLMKLLGVSSSLAPQFLQDGRVITPPLWSTPLRMLWVESVVLCHVLGESLTGKSRIDIYNFVKNMAALASLNPKSQKAAGGTRMAALQVISGLFLNLPLKLSPWALDMLCIATKSLKSSGSAEPSYRLAAVQMATAVAVACREARLNQLRQQEVSIYDVILPGAMEERAIQESIKLIKQATTDKFPEIREAAAIFCSALAPLIILPMRSGDKMDPTMYLEEAIQLCWKNLDDECTAVSISWAEALARCLSTSITHGVKKQGDTNSSRRKDVNDSDVGDDVTVPEVLRYNSSVRNSKTLSISGTCKTLPLTLNYLVDQFIKAGGELTSSRLGGFYSTGGRAVRLGISMVLVKLLAMPSPVTAVIGVDYPIKQVLVNVLAMLGPEVEKQLGGIDTGGATSKGTGGFVFGNAKTKSEADGSLTRLATSRVLREGLAEMASEMVQLSMLHELTRLCTGQSVDQVTKPLNSQQLQVALIEISHLLTTLGDAAGSALEELIPLLTNSLKHPDHGVRYESAIGCAVVAASFPSLARQIMQQSLEEIQVQHAELVTQATIEEASKSTVTSPKRISRFGSKVDEISAIVDKTIHFQYAIHGHGFLISILLRQLPKLPGGLPSDLLSRALSVGEILVTCQYIDILSKVNPIGACTCARAGYGIICGALTVGPNAMEPHIQLLFSLWKRFENTIENGGKNFSVEQDLMLLDTNLSSIVAFLEHCSELLLAVPDALARTTLILERVLPLFLANGRLESIPTNPAAASRHESAKASIMEAFAWLPPGSFPMIANDVFSFALQHVQSGTDADVVSSLLPSLVNNEDKVLDAKSFCRVQRYDQVGGGHEIDYNCIALSSEAIHNRERETALNVRRNLNPPPLNEVRKVMGSRILALFAYDGIQVENPPTPLHEVGTWRKPVSPSCSSKVRLVDAAVQAFAATFGLKDGKEQQHAMILLEQMVPPLLAQIARAIGVNSSLAEDPRRSKTKSDDIAAVANITVVLLACLKSLPLHEATHDIPIGLGPPWMNKAKDLLLTLLPSTSNTVRRAAAEGLALLATLGVTEDAHTLQSAVLHSLDEVMQGNKPDGKPRAIPIEPISAARAGSLLTLGCIQRTAHTIKMIQTARAKGRSTASESVAVAQEHSLPTIQMLTRILPSIACHAVIRDAFIPRTYAIHAFNIILSYSICQKETEWTIEDDHLIKKAVESVTDNLLSCWTAVSQDIDGEQSQEKLSGEISFLSVILRMMTCLLPFLDEVTSSRFIEMASVISDNLNGHPVVLMEAMGFFEVVNKHKVSRFKASMYQKSWQLAKLAKPVPPSFFSDIGKSIRSLQCTEAAALLLSTLDNENIEAENLLEFLMDLIDAVAGSRTCNVESHFRGLASPREVDDVCSHFQIELSLINFLWNHDSQILKALSYLSSKQRWQVRCAACNLICDKLREISEPPPKFLTDALLAACASVVATSESHELRPVQELGAQLLAILVDNFGHIRDPSEPTVLLMEQYSSQIFASTKHAITLQNAHDIEACMSLFASGCQTLVALVKKSLLSDSASFKRLLRPIIPMKSEVPIVDLNNDGIKPFRGIQIVPHILKLYTFSSIFILARNGMLQSDCNTFLEDSSESSKGGISIHCAAAAIDSWRLLKAMDKGGFFYGNLEDLDTTSRKIILQSGPPCLAFAVIQLVKVASNSSNCENIRRICEKWLDLIIPLIFATFQNSIGYGREGAVGCFDAPESCDHAALCLISVQSLIENRYKLHVHVTTGIIEILSKIFSHLLLPLLCDGSVMQINSGDSNGCKGTTKTDCCVIESCHLLEVIAASDTISDDVDSKIIIVIFSLLEVIEVNWVSSDNEYNCSVLVSLMKCIKSLLERGSLTASLVKVMLNLSIDYLDKSRNESVIKAAESLMVACLSSSTISSSQQGNIALAMARGGKWKSWSTVVSRCPLTLSQSIIAVESSLINFSDPERQVQVFSAISRILQNEESEASSKVEVTLKQIGALILYVFKAYGVCEPPIQGFESFRVAISSDAMKIIMLAYQTLSHGDEHYLIAFLSVTFDVLIGIIQYNGLPNQSSTLPNANPLLGRLAAHFFVHVARTTPVAFKEAVSCLMSANGRVILEYAVRAEMSGYPTGSTAPPSKKVLNIKSFHK